jgi:hypothetical protein
VIKILKKTVAMLLTVKNIAKQCYTVVTLAVLLCCASCAEPPLPPPEPPAPAAEVVVDATEALFLNGDFANALLEYEHISETALAPEDRIPALYGLACTQLMLARSDEQLAEAIATLEQWDTEKGSSALTENRRLLILALKHQTQFMQNKILEQATSAKRKEILIAQQKEKITQLGAFVGNLQKQLDQLETIDENVQEKRKPL